MINKKDLSRAACGAASTKQSVLNGSSRAIGEKLRDHFLKTDQKRFSTQFDNLLEKLENIEKSLINNLDEKQKY